MVQSNTSSNNTQGRTRFANRLINNGPKTKLSNKDFSKPTKKITRTNEDQLTHISLPVGIEPEERDPLKQNYHELIKENPNIDTVQKWIGKAGDGLNTAKEATGNIFGSLGGISKLGLKKSTSNPTATTVIAGAGSILTGLLSIKNLFSTFKAWKDPKQPIPWPVDLIKSILQGGVSLGLAAPFLGKGEKSPFIKRVDGEDVVEIKALLGGIGGIAGLSLMTQLGLGTSPLNKIPIAGKLLKDIFGDGLDATKQLSTSGEINNQNTPTNNQNQFGLAA